MVGFPFRDVALRAVYFNRGLTAFVSNQALTPSGSHKYYPAEFIVRSWRRLDRRPAVAIISSSGNMALALATVTAGEIGFTLIVVTDVLSPPDLIEKLRSFPHVRVEIVDKPDETGSHIHARYARIEECRVQLPGAIVVDQYGDPRIPFAYRETLVQDVLDAMGGSVGNIFCAVGTAGHGLAFLEHKASHLAEYDLELVDVENSRLFHNNTSGRRRFSGIGNGKPTAFSRQCGEKEPNRVNDFEIVRACDFLLETQGLFVGPSSGAVAAAFLKMADETPHLLSHSDPTVLIFPDSGHAYRSTLYDDDWRIANGLGSTIKGP